MALEFPTRILAVIERSVASQHALTTACHLAQATGSELHIVYVVLTRSTIRGRPATPMQRDAARSEGEAALKEARDQVAGLGGHVTDSYLRSANTLDQALNQAESDIEAGLLVIGAERATGIAQRLLASGEGVDLARRSTASILLVRPPTGGEATSP